MKPQILINGRFLAQPLSGVQRFATEITASLLRLHPDRVTVLGPKGVERAAIPARPVGQCSGQVWEQFELPRYAEDGVLVNLGNTGPLGRRRQIVVLHDAAVHAAPEAYDWKFRLWYKFMQKRLIDRGALAVTVSEFSRQELGNRLGIAPGKIEVIAEGADHMHAINAETAVLQTLPPGRFVLAVGNLAAHKNLRALSELATHLRTRDALLVITGGLASGPFRPDAANALPDAAHYVGRVSDGALKALYQAAACLVFPSLYEGYGLPAVEAMACGCPVAASDIPALLEVCGDAAVFFDPRSPGDVAGQVCRILDDAALRESLQKAGLAHVSGLTWARAAARLAGVADAHFGTAAM